MRRVHCVAMESVVDEGLVLSVSDAAEALGVSEDLVYELTQRGELPCLRLGRRKVIPRRAIEVVIERAMDGFDPNTVLVRLASAKDCAQERGAPANALSVVPR